EVHGLRRDGTVFPMHLSIGEYSIAGERYFTGIVYDLTKQRTLEARLDREQALFRSIFENLPDPVMISEPDCRIRLVNPAFGRTFGDAQGEVAGRSCHALCESPDDAEQFGRQGAGGGGFGPLTMQFRRCDGRSFPARAVHRAIFDRNGNTIGNLTLIHD